MVFKAIFALTFTLLGLTSPASAYVVVGYDGEPFYFKNGSQGIGGACYEIVRELCARQKVTCKYKIAQIPKILEMLKKGSADISCPLAITDERKSFVNFSEKIFKTHYAFFAKPEDAKKINKLEDLNGYSVSVFAPSFTAKALADLNKENGDIFKILSENAEMTSLMKAEKVGGTLAYINGDIAQRWIQRSHSNLVELPVAKQNIYYYIGFSKKSIPKKTLEKLLATLQDLQKEKFMQKSAATHELFLPEEETPNKAIP